MRGNLKQSVEGTYEGQQVKITVSHIADDPLTYDFFVHRRARPDDDYVEVGFVTIKPDAESIIHANMLADAVIAILMPVAAERVLNPRGALLCFTAERLIQMLGHSGATAYFCRRPNGEYAYTFNLTANPLKTIRIPPNMLYDGSIREEHEDDVIGFIMELGLTRPEAEHALACASNPALLRQLEERQPKFQPDKPRA